MGPTQPRRTRKRHHLQGRMVRQSSTTTRIPKLPGTHRKRHPRLQGRQTIPTTVRTRTRSPRRRRNGTTTHLNPLPRRKTSLRSKVPLRPSPKPTHLHPNHHRMDRRTTRLEPMRKMARQVRRESPPRMRQGRHLLMRQDTRLSRNPHEGRKPKVLLPTRRVDQGSSPTCPNTENTRRRMNPQMAPPRSRSKI